MSYIDCQEFLWVLIIEEDATNYK